MGPLHPDTRAVHAVTALPPALQREQNHTGPTVCPPGPTWAEERAFCTPLPSLV